MSYFAMLKKYFCQSSNLEIKGEVDLNTLEVHERATKQF